MAVNLQNKFMYCIGIFIIDWQHFIVSQYFRLASRKSKLNEIDVNEEHTNNEVGKERKKKISTDKQANEIPLRKQKLKEEIASMINNLQEKDVYSEELMWKSRKRKDVNSNTTEKSSLVDIRKVFHVSPTIHSITENSFNRW